MDPAPSGAHARLLPLRLRSPGSFAAALLVLLAALSGPLESAAEASLAAHMVQHMLLIGVAAPLLAFAHPSPRLAGWPVAARRAVATAVRALQPIGRPRAAFALHAAAIWLAHAPRVVDWAAAYPWVHVLEHVVLIGTALAFWWALLRAHAARSAAAPLLALGTLIHTGLLGALLALAPHALYPGYGLEDQQLAGLIMWVPGGLCYLAAGLAIATAWVPRAG